MSPRQPQNGNVVPPTNMYRLRNDGGGARRQRALGHRFGQERIGHERGLAEHREPAALQLEHHRRRIRLAFLGGLEAVVVVLELPFPEPRDARIVRPRVDDRATPEERRLIGEFRDVDPVLVHELFELLEVLDCVLDRNGFVAEVDQMVVFVLDLDGDDGAAVADLERRLYHFST